MKGMLEKGLSMIDGEFGWIRYQKIETTHIMAFGKDIEVAISEKQGGNVRVYKDGNFGLSVFTDPENVVSASKMASELAKVVRKETVSLKKPKQVMDRAYPDLKSNPLNVPFEQKVELIRNYQKIFLDAKDKIRNSVLRYLEMIVKNYILRTDGSYIEEQRVYNSMGFSAFVVDGTRVQPFFESIGDQRGFETVLNREKDIENAISNAIMLLKAEKVEGGVYTVILDPEIAGVFIHEAFGHLSEADHLHKNEKLREIMKPGTRMGDEILNVIDDGSIKGERGYYKYDDEGVLSSKTYLIKDGFLNSRLHSIYTASLMDEGLTGNARALDYRFSPLVRMSCTYIEPQDKSFEELLEGVDRGLYIKGAIGGQTELEMFTFTAKMAYKIERGEIKEPVRDVVLSGNVFETLKNIDAVGKDLKLFGGIGGCGRAEQYPLPVSDGGPHVRIKNVLIGGK